MSVIICLTACVDLPHPQYMVGNGNIMAKMLKYAFVFASTLALAACNSPGADSTPEAKADAAEPSGKDWTQTITETPEGGYRMGNPDADVKLIEFASFTCNHCRDFHNESKEVLQNDYVKTGKLLYEYRPFMLNIYDFTAAMLAMCEGPSRFFFWTDQFYSAYDAWVTPFTKLTDADVEPLKSLPPEQQVGGLARAGKMHDFAKTRGLPGAKFDACFTNQTMVNSLEARQKAAISQFDVQGTPTFVLNGKKVDGVTTWEQLQPKIEAAL